MSRPVYSVLHTTIVGATIDRERGWPDLGLEMRPIGTALPANEQKRELTLRIGSRGVTTLDEDGIQALAEFLVLKPSAGGSHPDD